MCSQSVEIKYSEKFIRRNEAAEQETEKYHLFRNLMMGSENVIFIYAE